MNELTLTVTGWAATDPKMHIGPSGVRLATFRLASTPRYFDRNKNEWTDGQTEWFSVRVFKGASITVAKSVAKGQPLMVHGRVKTHEWESDTGPRTELTLDAITVGHDLTRGFASFVRAVGDESLGEDEVEPADAGGQDGDLAQSEDGTANGDDVEDAGNGDERERQPDPVSA